MKVTFREVLECILLSSFCPVDSFGGAALEVEQIRLKIRKKNKIFLKETEW